MKKLVNLDKANYVTLPGGLTINAGSSMLVLNESLLETPEVKRLLKGNKVQVEDASKPSNGPDA